MKVECDVDIVLAKLCTTSLTYCFDTTVLRRFTAKSNYVRPPCSILLNLLLLLYFKDILNLRKHLLVYCKESGLGPILCLLHTKDIAQAEDTTMASFSDYIAIMAITKIVEVAVQTLQKSVAKVST